MFFFEPGACSLFHFRSYISRWQLLFINYDGCLLRTDPLVFFLPTDELRVTLGAGLGAGVAAIGGVGVQAGRTEGFTTKTTAGGGFGGAGSASLGFSEEGVNASATVGGGVGAVVTTTIGYTWNFQLTD